MKLFRLSVLSIGILILLAACTSQKSTPTPPPQASQATELESRPVGSDRELALTAFQKGGCAACHIIPGVPGATGSIGPDLTDIHKTAEQRIADGAYTGTAKNVEECLAEALIDPDGYISPDCDGSPCQKGLMPASLAQSFSEAEFNITRPIFCKFEVEIPIVL